MKIFFSSNLNQFLKTNTKNFYNHSITIGKLFFITFILILMLTGCNVIGNVSKEDFIRSITISDPDLSTVSDGTYSGSYKIIPPPGAFALFTEIAVDVRITTNQYYKIDIKTDMVKDDPKWIDFAQRIVDKQSLQIDGVTGATYATIAMKKAIVKAVTKEN